MKVLIAYDGSGCSEAALDDLVKAGLPEAVEAMVVSVAEIWLPPQNERVSGNVNADGVKLDPQIENVIKAHREKDKKILAEAQTYANHARRRLQSAFPGWNVSAEAAYGSATWEVLARADEFKPDLILVGSQGRSVISKFILGSISQRILTEAYCSVRVARGRVEVDPAPSRLIIGFNGSQGARAAVDAVASRQWPNDTQIRLVAATERIATSAIGRFVSPTRSMVEEVDTSEQEWLEKIAEPSLAALRSTGLQVELRIITGNPKCVLAYEAETWSADCIFIGANAYGSRFERFLLGSTSAAVAARAHCSVEVVRRQPQSHITTFPR